MIKIDQLTLKIGQRPLLKQLSFELKEGDLTVLIGANGVGKSTLLKTLAGTRLPNISVEGKLQFQQKDLAAYNALELSKQRAVMSQKIQLYFPITVLELVMLGRSAQSCSNAVNLTIAKKALSYVDMLDFQHRNMQSLSGGEQQRAHLARALAQIWPEAENTSKLLILDEPTAGLDVHYQHFILEKVKQCCIENGLTVLAVLHDINIAAQYADEMIVLKKGGLLKKGKPQDILTPETIQEAFGISAVIQQHPLRNCPQVLTYY